MITTADEWANGEAIGFIFALVLICAWVVGGWIARWIARNEQ